MERVADRGVKKKSQRLEGRRIALGICGGIGAVESVRAIRELRRHGASVKCFLTPSAIRFIGELSLEWASGSAPVMSATAEVDHLEEFDLAIIAPITWNTIAKCASGISDNAVTLLVAGQLGRKAPLGMVPTMNEQLLKHPLYSEYRNRLESWGVKYLEPPLEEGRYKMPSPEQIVELALSLL